MPPRIAIVSELPKAVVTWPADALQAQYVVKRYAMSPADLEQVAAWQPDLVICDLLSSRVLPELALSHLRSLVREPILVLGPARDEAFLVQTIKLGADGYLSEPFGAEELLARVAAHLRRYWEWEGQRAVTSETGLQIDRDACSVLVRNRIIKLTPTECRLLARLAEQKGQVVPREELSNYLWGLEGAHDASGLVSLYIHYLRKKLERDPRFPRYIRTKRGGGYYLAPDGA